MATPRFQAPALEGETRFGPQRPSIQGILGCDSGASKASLLYLNATDGTTFYLWFDTNGKLRTDSTPPVDPNADGTVVGTQA